MDEQTKQFAIRLVMIAVVVTVVAVGLYYMFSPYENCIRLGNYGGKCLVNTSW